MFSNPFTAVMALILLAFIGTLVIFFCIWREIDALRRNMQDMRSNMQFAILDMEQQSRDHAVILRELRQLTGNDADLGEMLEKGIGNLEERFIPKSGEAASYGAGSSYPYPDLPSMAENFGIRAEFSSTDAAFLSSAGLVGEGNDYATQNELESLPVDEGNGDAAFFAFADKGKSGA